MSAKRDHKCYAFSNQLRAKRHCLHNCISALWPLASDVMGRSYVMENGDRKRENEMRAHERPPNWTEQTWNVMNYKSQFRRAHYIRNDFRSNCTKQLSVRTADEIIKLATLHEPSSILIKIDYSGHITANLLTKQIIFLFYWLHFRKMWIRFHVLK